MTSEGCRSYPFGVHGFLDDELADDFKRLQLLLSSPEKLASESATLRHCVREAAKVLQKGHTARS